MEPSILKKSPPRNVPRWQYVLFLVLAGASIAWAIRSNGFFRFTGWMFGYTIEDIFIPQNGWMSLSAVKKLPESEIYIGVGAREFKGDFIAGVVAWSTQGANRMMWSSSQIHTDDLHDLAWTKDGAFLLSSTKRSANALLLESKSGKLYGKVRGTVYDLLDSPSSRSGHNGSQETAEYNKVLEEGRAVIGSVKPLGEWDTENLHPARAYFGDLEAYVPSGARGIHFWSRSQRADLDLNLRRTDGSDAPDFLRFRPDGKVLAAGYDDGTILAWSIPEGKELWRVRPHRNLIYAMEWNPTGTELASSAYGGCDFLRSECVVVTQVSSQAHTSRVVWSRWNRVTRAIQWTSEDRLLLTMNDRAIELKL